MLSNLILTELLATHALDIEIALEECEDIPRVTSRSSNRGLIAACILSAMAAIAAVVLLRKSSYHLNISFFCFLNRFRSRKCVESKDYRVRTI